VDDITGDRKAGVRRRGFEYNEGMDIEIRPITTEQWAEFARVMGIVFGESDSDEELADHKRGFEFDRSMAAFDGDRIVSTGGADSLELTLPGGTSIPVGGLTAISVLPTHRRRGILRAMIQRHFEDVEARGEPVSALGASESVIYGRFGYGMATVFADYEIDPRYGAFLPGIAPGGGRLRIRSERSSERFDALAMLACAMIFFKTLPPAARTTGSGSSRSSAKRSSSRRDVAYGLLAMFS
jgi:predicted N-acetyltransferase YhbS